MADGYASIEGAHYSTLKELDDRSPRHFAYLEEHGREEASHFAIGSATHLAVLEPKKFPDKVEVWEKRNGKRTGRAWDAFEAAAKAKDRIILTEDEHEEVLALSRAVRASPQARKYLELGGEAEVAVEWTDAETGIKCKARLDWICGLGIVDLKTTRDASPEGFSKECARYGYHKQAGFYVDGYAQSHVGLELPFSIIAVEKVPPFVVQVYRIGGDVLELGRDIMRASLKRLAELRKIPVGEWPGYADGPLDLELPRWAMPYDDEAGIEMLSR